MNQAWMELIDKRITILEEKELLRERRATDLIELLKRQNEELSMRIEKIQQERGAKV